MEIVSRKVVTYVDDYVAIDGTTFTTKEECERYERSARCVLMNKYVKLIQNNITEWDMFGIGSEEENIDIIRLSSAKDVDLIMQLIALDRPKCATDSEWMSKRVDRLTRALDHNSIIGIGRGYDNDNFYIAFTGIEILEKINKLENAIN